MGELIERLRLDGRHLLGTRLEEKAGLRQLHAAFLAREERRAEFFLEILQPPRERRLRQMKFLSRSSPPRRGDGRASGSARG